MDIKIPMTIINLLIALASAIVGGIVGHRMTISLQRARTKSLENAFYTEFDIIYQDFKDYLNTSIDEYKNPLRDEYTEPALYDIDLIESITIELAATEKIVTANQRRFISWLKLAIKTLKDNEAQRRIHIENWLQNGHSMDTIERQKITRKIKHLTAERLFAILQLLFGIEKFIKQKSRFTGIKNENHIDYAKSVCHQCNIDFEELFWKEIINKITGK